MTKRKIINHYRGRRYAKKRYPNTFAISQDPVATPEGRANAARFIEAIGLAYVAGLAAAEIADNRMLHRAADEQAQREWAKRKA